jgi:hypothetical protein
MSVFFSPVANLNYRHSLRRMLILFPYDSSVTCGIKVQLSKCIHAQHKLIFCRSAVTVVQMSRYVDIPLNLINPELKLYIHVELIAMSLNLDHSMLFYKIRRILA